MNKRDIVNHFIRTKKIYDEKMIGTIDESLSILSHHRVIIAPKRLGLEAKQSPLDRLKGVFLNMASTIAIKLSPDARPCELCMCRQYKS